MKLLFDQNLSYKLCRSLADLFPDSAQVRRAGLAEADDRAVWSCAAAHGFTLVSFDADFVEMAMLDHRQSLFGFDAATNRPQ